MWSSGVGTIVSNAPHCEWSAVAGLGDGAFVAPRVLDTAECAAQVGWSNESMTVLQRVQAPEEAVQLRTERRLRGGRSARRGSGERRAWPG